jgi:transcriptional regulator with XRE-family HTH domain
MDDSEFGARLALVRQRMRWNIKEAAKECGLPAASWASWENGAMPRKYTEVCEKVAERTGADYLWLMAGSRSSARTSGSTLSVKYPYGSIGRSDEVPDRRKADPPPIGPGRTDPVRPMSAVPARHRRPQPTRPGVRRMPR